MNDSFRGLSSSNWRRAARLGVLTLLVLAGCGRMRITAEDALADPDGRTRLFAHVERDHNIVVRDSLAGQEVTFFVDGGEVGRSITNDDGEAAATCAAASRPASFEARVRGDRRQISATGRVFAWRRDRTAIAVDLDKTVIDNSAREFLRYGLDDLRTLPDAQPVLTSLAGRFDILYLTARPRTFLNASRRWLSDHDFPEGPVIAAPGVADALAERAFKQRILIDLRKRWPNLLIGIGDQESDAEAYGAAGMLTIILAPHNDDEFPPHAVLLPDWRRVGDVFDANAGLLTDAAQLSAALQSGRLMLMQPVATYLRDP